MNTPKIVIIGAGPAGIATSIQLKRLGYEPQLIEKDTIGGLLWNANLIENYPGFPQGIRGNNLVHLMIKQLKQLEIKIEYSEVTKLLFKDDFFHLKTDRENIVSDYVVIASGTKPKPIDIRVTDQVRKRIRQDIRNILGIDGKHIVIIGAGDAAFDHALYLSKKNRVSIINRGTKIRSLQLLVERVFSNDKIEYLSNTKIEDIDLLSRNQKNANVFEVRCNSLEKGKISKECDEIVFAIGRDPQLDFMDEIIEDVRCIQVGDVKNGLFRQATIAIGDGIKAAMKINNQILLRCK